MCLSKFIHSSLALLLNLIHNLLAPSVHASLITRYNLIIYQVLNGVDNFYNYTVMIIMMTVFTL